jgi:hypothetical protein
MRTNHNIAAAGLALIGSAIFSIIDNFVGAVAQEAGMWQSQLFRTLFTIPLLLAAARFPESRSDPETLPALSDAA